MKIPAIVKYGRVIIPERDSVELEKYLERIYTSSKYEQAAKDLETVHKLNKKPAFQESIEILNEIAGDYYFCR